MAEWLDHAKQRLLRDPSVSRPKTQAPTSSADYTDYTDIIAAFNRKVRRSGPAIERCHRNLIKKDSRYENETIRLRVALDLQPSGQAANLRFSPTTNERFETCMKTVSQLWRVEPHTAGTLRLQYPVTLVPIGGKRPRVAAGMDRNGNTGSQTGPSEGASGGSPSVLSDGASVVASAETATTFEQYVEPVPERFVVDRIVASLNVRVDRSRERIRRCYVRLLKQDSRMWTRPITLKMTLLVDSAGGVKTAGLAPDLGRSFDACLSTVVESWSVRPFEGSNVLLQYQVKLVPDNQPPTTSSLAP